MKSQSQQQPELKQIRWCFPPRVKTILFMLTKTTRGDFLLIRRRRRRRRRHHTCSSGLDLIDRCSRSCFCSLESSAAAAAATTAAIVLFTVRTSVSPQAQHVRTATCVRACVLRQKNIDNDSNTFALTTATTSNRSHTDTTEYVFVPS